MSILIKGIDMPKRHLFEAFVAIGDGQIVVKDLEKNKENFGNRDYQKYQEAFS